MKNYYYLDNYGSVQGPVNYEQLEALHKTGRINSSTQVCEEGAEEWVPFYQLEKANKIVNY